MDYNRSRLIHSLQNSRLIICFYMIAKNHIAYRPIRHLRVITTLCSLVLNIKLKTSASNKHIQLNIMIVSLLNQMMILL